MEEEQQFCSSVGAFEVRCMGLWQFLKRVTDVGSYSNLSC